MQTTLNLGPMNKSTGAFQRLQEQCLEMLGQLRSELDSMQLIQPINHIQGRVKLGASNQGQEKQILENSTVNRAEMDALKLKLEESMAEASRLQGLMDQIDELFPRYDNNMVILSRSFVFPQQKFCI